MGSYDFPCKDDSKLALLDGRADTYTPPPKDTGRKFRSTYKKFEHMKQSPQLTWDLLKAMEPAKFSDKTAAYAIHMEAFFVFMCANTCL